MKVLAYVKELAEKQTGRSMTNVPLTSPRRPTTTTSRSAADECGGGGGIHATQGTGMDGGCLISEPVAAICGVMRRSTA